MCEAKINNDVPAGVAVTRKCKCCGEILPIDQFNTYGAGRYKKICKTCERKLSGISERFKEFSDRDLINELRSRGWAGTLRYTKVEEIDL